MSRQDIEEISISRIEVDSDDENVRISMLIPDFSLKDLKMKITDQNLEVKGAKIVVSEMAQKAKVKKSRTTCKTFQRTISFPANVLSEKAEAQFVDGVLTVTAPISSQSRKKCIASIIQVH